MRANLAPDARFLDHDLTGRGCLGGMLSSLYPDVLFFDGRRGTVPGPHYLRSYQFKVMRL
ncbi:hypothetical protein K443DRAFT_331309 [Laccaria amethystina LaAM-08-1]|uniref:Uncharacterized protein n=1 Tax=Laccaria amethystina LaAM-08-1 TaxID=1095629 RepID=A0A0C9XGN6_9AGAR|nr:hypothetical protein K443DRAFT_331309 [Laccaria amethystina LaAM-08-1]